MPKVGKECLQRQHHLGDCIDIKDVFRDYMNLVEFLIPLGICLCIQAGLALTTMTTSTQYTSAMRDTLP